MARVTFLNAILSGKLGGTVYAHNKGGYYVRQYSIPTNPNTIAQADARNQFAASITSWHNLNEAEKAVWNTYATTNFRGKDNDPTVLYSGINAYCSLRNVVNNAHRKSRHFAMYGNAVNALTFAQLEYTGSNAPPTDIFSQQIQASDNSPLNVIVKEIGLVEDGKAFFELEFFASPGPQTEAPIFIEPITLLKVGYALYASNVIGQPGAFVTKPNQTIIGTIETPQTITGWVEDDSFIRFVFDEADTSIPDHKLWYAANDLVRCEVWAIGQQGPIIRVGEKIVVVGAGP